MDAVALWIGYFVLVVGGISAAIGIAWVAADWCWRRLQDLYSWPWLMRAIRAHLKVEPRGPWK